MGRNTAVCTSAARNDEPVSSTMSQAAAMVCMPAPMKKIAPQTHRPRKAGWRSGLQMEVAVAVVMDHYSAGNRTTWARPDAKRIPSDAKKAAQGRLI
jgi:hypothetical protein